MTSPFFLRPQAIYICPSTAFTVQVWPRETGVGMGGLGGGREGGKAKTEILGRVSFGKEC